MWISKLNQFSKVSEIEHLLSTDILLAGKHLYTSVFKHSRSVTMELHLLPYCRVTRSMWTLCAGTHQGSTWHQWVKTQFGCGHLVLEARGSVCMSSLALATSSILVCSIRPFLLSWSLAVIRYLFIFKVRILELDFGNCWQQSDFWVIVNQLNCGSFVVVMSTKYVHC